MKLLLKTCFPVKFLIQYKTKQCSFLITLTIQYNTQPNIKLAENKNSMFLTPVTTQEILNIISKLKNSRSSGIDDIPDFLIKKMCYSDNNSTSRYL